MIEFLYPWMFVLLPLPLLIRLMRPYRRYVPHVRAPMYSTLAALSKQQPKQAAWIHRRSPLQVVILLVNWVLVLAALARPQWMDEPMAIEQQRRDLMVLVDISGSMNERDQFNNTRLQQVKEVLQTFADQRQGDRLGLIVFADKPYMQAPITGDNDVWRHLLMATQVGPAGRNTAMGDAIGLGLKHLQAMENQEKVMLLLTDGSDTRSLVPPREAAIVAAQRSVRIFTVAVGDATDNADIDTETLQEVAEISGGQYYDARSTQSMAMLASNFAQAVPSDFSVEWYYPARELYFYPLFILFTFAMGVAIVSFMKQRRGGRL